MSSALVLPEADERVSAAMGRLSRAAMLVAMPGSLRERLAVPLGEAERVALAADIDRLAGLLASNLPQPLAVELPLVIKLPGNPGSCAGTP